MQHQELQIVRVRPLNVFILLQGYTPLGHLLVLLVFIISLFAIFGLMWLFVSICQIRLFSIDPNSDFENIPQFSDQPFSAFLEKWKDIQMFDTDLRFLAHPSKEKHFEKIKKRRFCSSEFEN